MIMSDLAHIIISFPDTVSEAAHQVGLVVFNVVNWFQDCVLGVATSLVANDLAQHLETAFCALPRAVVVVFAKTLNLLMRRHVMLVSGAAVISLFLSIMSIRLLNQTNNLNQQHINDFNNVQPHAGGFVVDQTEEDQFDAARVEPESDSERDQNDDTSDEFNNLYNDSFDSDDFDDLMSDSESSDSSDSADEKKKNTVRYLNHQNFSFILKEKQASMRKFIQHFRNTIFTALVLQTKDLGPFARKLTFLEETVVFNQRDYRPDINSNGPMKHKNALISRYNVRTYRIVNMEIIFYGVAITLPLKKIVSVDEEIEISNSLIQNNAGIRTISPSKSLEQVDVAIRSVIINSTTVNVDKGLISQLKYVQEGTVRFLTYLYHHQAHLSWYSELDF